MILLYILEDYPTFVAIMNGQLKSISLHKGDLVGGLAFSQSRNLVKKQIAVVVKVSK